jgi:hypothetical protein
MFDESKPPMSNGKILLIIVVVFLVLTIYANSHWAPPVP